MGSTSSEKRRSGAGGAAACDLAGPIAFVRSGRRPGGMRRADGAVALPLCRPREIPDLLAAARAVAESAEGKALLAAAYTGEGLEID